MAQNIDTPYITDPALRKQLEESVTGKMKYTLMNDFLAKYGLQKDLFALKGLLAALLELPLDSITDIQIMNPTEPSGVIRDKDCILDIKLELNHGKLVNIEIQSNFQEFWANRSVTYMSKMFDNLREGDDYDRVKACVHIGILDFALYEQGSADRTKEFYSDYRILNTKTHHGFTDNFVIKALMLGNMENASREQKEDYGSVYYWAKLFKAKTWEELRMIAKNNERMESLVNTASRLSVDRSVQEACESRIMHRLDINTLEHRIQERDLTIDTYLHRLQKKEEMIESLEQDMQKKDEIIESQTSMLAKKEDELQKLRQKLAQYEG